MIFQEQFCMHERKLRTMVDAYQKRDYDFTRGMQHEEDSIIRLHTP